MSSEALYQIALLVLSILFIVITTAKFKLHPFLALILAALGYGLLTGMKPVEVVTSINAGFGGTIGAIGIVILAGTIIGVFLEKSGGAQTLADSAIRLTGEKNVPLAMGLVGYVVSMPVFCDSGFVLISPLNKALSRRAGITVASGAVALSLGLYATHTMVPPTPGPVAATGIVGANLGLVIGLGLAVAFVAMLAGWLFAVTYAARVYIDPGQPATGPEAVGESTEAQVYQPGIFRSVLPIVIPIILIILASVAGLKMQPLGTGPAIDWLLFFGQPVVALLIGVALALLLPRKLEAKLLSSGGWVGEAVLAASSIIIITGAGGAFGKVLQTSGIAKVLGDALASYAGMGVLLPFLIAAAIKTAQGSSTVSMITTASIVAPLLATIGLDSETGKALAVIAIGAGAMVVSHANDSYFWVVTQFSGMSAKQGFKLQTLGTLIEGCTAAAVVYVLASLFA